MAQCLLDIDMNQEREKRSGVFLAICHRLTVTSRYFKTGSVDQWSKLALYAIYVTLYDVVYRIAVPCRIRLTLYLGLPSMITLFARKLHV